MLKKILLNESDIPDRWYNILPDMPAPPAPYLNPRTLQPMGPADLAPIFPQAIIAQEVSAEPWIEIPEQVRDVYKMWRPQLGLGGGRGGVHVHYAMGLAADAYDGVVERLRSRGYNVLDHDHGAYGHGRGRAAYVTDPGGHVVEFWTWDVAGHLTELAAGESPGSH